MFDDVYDNVERTAEMNQANFRGLLKGMKKFCEANPGAMKAREMYREKLERYKTMYSPTQHAPTAPELTAEVLTGSKTTL